MNTKTYLSLLKRYKDMPNCEKETTFLEIAGYPHYELVCNNILQFYFQPTNEHGLKDLFIKTLLSMIEEANYQDIDFYKVDVHRDWMTPKGNCLDLLIHTSHYVIGIENKLFYHLEDDVGEYSHLVDGLCKRNARKSVKVIFSLHNQIPETIPGNGFVYITYETFFCKIMDSLPSYPDANQKHLIYLRDFIKTIQKINTNTTMDNKELLSFFKTNGKRSGCFGKRLPKFY